MAYGLGDDDVKFFAELNLSRISLDDLDFIRDAIFCGEGYDESDEQRIFFNSDDPLCAEGGCRYRPDASSRANIKDARFAGDVFF